MSKNRNSHSIAPRGEVIPLIDTSDLDFMPCADYVLLELVGGDRTEAGILIPESAQANAFPRWKVVAVGPGYRSNTTGEVLPVRVQVGDQVMISPQHGAAFDIPGRSTKTHLVSESCIIAVVRRRAELQ